MLMTNLRFILIVLALLLVAHPANALDANGSSPRPATTPAQAQQTLAIPQDDEKRPPQHQPLRTAARACQPIPSTPTASSPVPADNLGVQLLVQVSDWFGDVSSQLAAGARTLSD